jgi:hypothetical protein
MLPTTTHATKGVRTVRLKRLAVDGGVLSLFPSHLLLLPAGAGLYISKVRVLTPYYVPEYVVFCFV